MPPKRTRSASPVPTRGRSPRKMAKPALRFNDKKFATVFQTSPDAIMLNRLSDGVFLEVNRVFTDITGYTRKDVIGHSTLPGDLSLWVDKSYRDQFVAGLKSHGEVINLEGPFRHKNGAIRQGSISARVIQVGKVPCILAIARDITENKQREKSLYYNQAKFQAVFENPTVAVATVGLNGQFLEVNPTWTKLLGYSPAELLQMNFLQITHSSDRETSRETVQNLVDNPSQKGIHLVKRYLHRDGHTVWGELFSTLVCDSSGQPQCFITLMLDITQRKNAEQAAAEERKRLLVTLRSIGDGVITTDIQGHVILMNKVAETLTGWTQGEAAGRPLSEIFVIQDEDTRRPRENPVKKVLTQSQTLELGSHTLLASRDGTERLIAESGAPILNESGIPLGIVLVFRDITERQKWIENSHTTAKLDSLSVLAGGIAHDFNNLLGGIFGNIDLAHKASQDARVSGYLKETLATLERARSLTHQLLTFAKGGAPLKEHQALGPFLQETAKFALSGSAVTLTLDLAPDLWNVNFDKNQICQVVDNLFINALQAMPQGGTIRLAAANLELERHFSLPPGKYVRVSLTDQGTGIPPELLPRIFDPFFTTKPKGSGLGLSTAYSIVKRHDGCLEVESRPGAGTTFHIYLPACSEAKAAAPKFAAGAAGPGSGKILVLDDEPSIRSIVEAMLTHLGYTPVCVKKSSEAIQTFQTALHSRQPFQAAILDLTIPGDQGGYATAQTLLQLDPGILLFIASGYAQDPLIANPQAYGFADSIRKPFTLSELAELLGRHFKNTGLPKPEKT